MLDLYVNVINFSQRAEKVLEKAQKMIESLNEADAAQNKAKEAIKKSNEDIELARADLEQVCRFRMTKQSFNFPCLTFFDSIYLNYRSMVKLAMLKAKQPKQHVKWAI